MMRRAPPPGTIILLILAVLSGIFFVKELGQEVPTSQMTAANQNSIDVEFSDAASFTLLLPEVEASYDLIVERPLFSETRRPFLPKSQTASIERTEKGPALDEADVRIVPPDLRLKGLMVERAHRSALIEWPLGEARWYAEADEIDGWRIETITLAEITLTRQDVTHVFQLYDQP